MRRMNTRGLIAALEEEEVIAAVAEAVAEPELENAESLETELLEVQEVVEEGAVREEEVAEAIEVSDALDEYQEALESITGQGGLDRNGAMILQIGIEQLCARVGLESTNIAMPSMESYGGASTRIDSTKLAMEGVKEAAAKVGKAIVAAIISIGTWLKNFWKTLTDSNHRLKARAEKIIGAAKAASGEAKEKELENASLANKLHTNGKVEKQFGQDFSDFAKFCEAMSSKVVPGVVSYSKQVAESIAKSVADQESEDITFKAAGVKAAYAGVALSAGDGEAAEGMEVLKSKQLLGGKALIVQMPTQDGVDGAIAFAKGKSGIGMFKASVVKATSDKMPVLSTNEISGIAEGVLAVSKSVDTLRALEKDFDAFVKALMVGAKGFEKSAELANDAGNAKVVAMKKKMNSIRNSFSSFATRVSNMPAGFGSYALSTSKASMDYCELSLKQYK